MVVFPNCKINIGLQILDKREDGFHNLETVFCPVPVKDVLEVIRAKDGTQQHITFTQSGNAVSGDADDNLCVKAYQLLKKDFPQLPPVQMHLHKAIPIGAGLGGGSADGAFALKLFNDKFRLHLSTEQLIAYALQLGSDCPFFILNKPGFASGRGEILMPADVSLAGYQLMIVNPGIHINTGWAFSQLKKEKRESKNLFQSIQQPIENWRHTISNDFEAAVFPAHPVLEEIKTELYRQGALYAAMSGSGSTLYGLFSKTASPLFHFPGHYFIKSVLL